MKSKLSPLRISLARQLAGRILDCGSGEDLFGPHLRREGNDVISLDIDAEALKNIAGKTVQASCTDIPFPDDTFDAVWACAIIEHVKAETLPEMIRVTRPGGRLIAVTPNAHSPFDAVKRLLGMATWWENPGHVRLYTARELRCYGPVRGETRFLPHFGWFFRRFPEFAHVLVLNVRVTAELKAKAASLRPALPRR
jgi:SAM-dependent methyltransferase